MRIARLLSLVLAVLTAGSSGRTDRGRRTTVPGAGLRHRQRGVLSQGQRTEVENAVDKLYNDKRDPALGGLRRQLRSGARSAGRRTHDAAQRFRRPGRAAGGRHRRIARTRSRCRHDSHGAVRRCRHLRRNSIEPALRRSDWAGAAVAAANGLNTAVDVDRPRDLLVRRARRAGGPRPAGAGCCGCGRAGAGASGARPSSRRPSGWTRPTRTRWPRCRSTRSTTCPRRSSSTSTTPCAPATTNWLWPSRNSATAQTAPFSHAVTNAKTTLAQAFNVRQILDDAVPESAAAAPRPADPGGRRRRQGRPGTGRPDGGVRQAARSGDQRADAAGLR